MSTTYYISLPLFLKEPLNPEPRSTTKCQLYYMKFVENEYPVIDNIEIFIVRSSPGGLSFRFFPGPLTNTIDLRGAGYSGLYPDINSENTWVPTPRGRGVLINHWNFDRFTFFYNQEVAPVAKGITFSEPIKYLFRNTGTLDETFVVALVYMLISLGNFRLSYTAALDILEMDPKRLINFRSLFDNKNKQYSACQIIQAYWIIKQTYLFNKVDINAK